MLNNIFYQLSISLAYSVLARVLYINIYMAMSYTVIKCLILLIFQGALPTKQLYFG